MIFPSDNLPTAAKPWAREITKQLSNLIEATASNEINNAARDNQLNSSIIAASAAATTAQEAADAAGIAASDAATAASDAATAADDAAAAAATANQAIDIIGSLGTYSQQINDYMALTTGTATNTLNATFSVNVNIPESGGARNITVTAFGDCDLKVIPEVDGINKVTVGFNVLYGGSSIGGMTTYCGVNPSVNWDLTPATPNVTAVYGGGALVASGQITVYSSGIYSFVIRAQATKERPGGTDTFDGNLQIKSAHAMITAA